MFSLLNFKERFTQYIIIFLLAVISSQFIINGLGGIVAIFIVIWLIYKHRIAMALVIGIAILTFSDNRNIFFQFATQAKPIIVVLIFVSAYFLRTSNLIFKSLIPFFLLAFFCISRSPNTFISFQKTLSLCLLYISTPLILNDFLDKTKDRGAIKILFIVPLIILLFGLLIHQLNPNFTTISGRYRGLLGNPNGLGIFIIVYFLLFQTVKHVMPMVFSRHERWLILGLLFLSLFMTGSRTAIIVIILFYSFYWVFRFRLLVALFLCAILFAFGLFFTSNVTEIILALGLDEYFRLETLESGSGRTVAWAFAWTQIQENLLIGNGFTYTEYIYSKHKEALSLLDHQGNAHNSYLTIWLDTGLFGVILYFGALVCLFVKAFQNYRLAIPILLCFAFSANMESWLAASLNPFTIVFCIILTLLLRPKDELQNLNPENLELEEVEQN